MATVKTDEFDIDKLILSKDVEENTHMYKIPILYNYDNKNRRFILETSWIENKITFAANEIGEPHITVFLDENQGSCNNLKSVLDKMGNKINSQMNILITNTKAGFSKQNNAIIKYGEDPIKLNKSGYANFKLLLEYNTNKILTKVKYQSISQKSLKDVNVESFDDIKNKLVKDCDFRMIIALDRISFSKKDLSFGTKFVVLRIDIKAPYLSYPLKYLPDIVEFQEDLANSDGDHISDNVSDHIHIAI